MAKLKVAEIFYSLQGEGKWAGVPSVFLRTFGCNFQCRGFGMPRGELTDEPEIIAKDVDSYKDYDSLPLSEFGCDSYASWHPAFKHLSPVMEVSDIVDTMHNMIPYNKWGHELAHTDDVHLVITGGEPLLGWQRAYPELIELCQSNGLKNITFETNGTQNISDDFREFLQDKVIRWGRNPERLTFSVSPKLPCSGEKWEDAIRPDIITEYQNLGETYLKFVVATKEDVEDVRKAVNEYRSAGFYGAVYLMPMGGLPSVYHLNTQEVAELAMREGYRYSPRLQVDIWKNAWGT